MFSDAASDECTNTSPKSSPRVNRKRDEDKLREMEAVKLGISLRSVIDLTDKVEPPDEHGTTTISALAT